MNRVGYKTERQGFLSTIVFFNGVHTTVKTHLDAIGLSPELYMARRDLGVSIQEALAGRYKKTGNLIFVSGFEEEQERLLGKTKASKEKKVIGYRFKHYTSHSGEWVPVREGDPVDGLEHMIF